MTSQPPPQPSPGPSADQPGSAPPFPGGPASAPPMSGSPSAPAAPAQPSRPVGEIIRPLRDLAAYALVGAPAIWLFIAVVRLIPSSVGQDFATRVQDSFYSFVNLEHILLPLTAVLLATLVKPEHKHARLITTAALVEYAVAGVFAILFGVLIAIVRIGTFNIRVAFEELLVRAGWLAVFAAAAYAVFLIWRTRYYTPRPRTDQHHGAPQWGPGQQWGHQYGQQPPQAYPPTGFGGQPQPGQPQPGQWGQPHPGQSQPGQPYPGPSGQAPADRSYPGQPLPGQFQPGQFQPGQPYPGQSQPYPGESQQGQPQPGAQFGQPEPGYAPPSWGGPTTQRPPVSPTPAAAPSPAGTPSSGAESSPAGPSSGAATSGSETEADPTQRISHPGDERPPHTDA